MCLYIQFSVQLFQVHRSGQEAHSHHRVTLTTTRLQNFSSPRAETRTPETASPFPPSPGPGSHHPTFCLRDLDGSADLIEGDSHTAYPFVSGLFHVGWCFPKWSQDHSHGHGHWWPRSPARDLHLPCTGLWLADVSCGRGWPRHSVPDQLMAPPLLQFRTESPGEG